jgi:hypothetical protein
MAIPDVTQSPITGTLSYEISYYVNGDPKQQHHTRKSLQFESYVGNPMALFVITGEYEN